MLGGKSFPPKQCPCAPTSLIVVVLHTPLSSTALGEGCSPQPPQACPRARGSPQRAAVSAGERPSIEQPGGTLCPGSTLALRATHPCRLKAQPAGLPKPGGSSGSSAAKPQYEMHVFRVMPLKSYLPFLTRYITLQYLKRFLSSNVENY